MFALIEGSDCGGKYSQSEILWYFTMVLTTLSMLPPLRLLYIRFMQKRVLWVFTYDVKYLFPPSILFTLMVFDVFAILKIIYRNEILIGRDIVISLVCTFAPILTMVCLVMYFLIVLNFLRGLTVSMAPAIGNKVIKRFNLLAIRILFIAPLFIISCVLPLLGIPLPKYRNVFAKVYFIGMGVTLTIYCSLLLNAFGFLLKELSNHIGSFAQSDHDIKTVYNRLRLAYYCIAFNCQPVAFSYFMFGFWDYLLTKTTYLVVFHLCGCALGSTVLILTISEIPRASRILPFAPPSNTIDYSDPCEEKDSEEKRSDLKRFSLKQSSRPLSLKLSIKLSNIPIEGQLLVLKDLSVKDCSL
jgi:hypothetical protein